MITLWLYSVGSPDVERHKDLMVVSSDGTVVWVPPVKYQSSCVIDMTDFPFDSQVSLEDPHPAQMSV